MSSTTAEITYNDLHDLLYIFERKPFEACSRQEGSVEDGITKKCEYLFKKDYAIIELDNTNGVLCPRYPRRIFIPEYEHGHMSASSVSPSTSKFNQETTNETLQYGTNVSDVHHDTKIMESNETSTTPSSNVPSSCVTSSQKKSQTNLHHQHQVPQQNTTTSATASNSMTNTTTGTIYEDLYDINKIRELITMAKYARCRQRFAVPVIMYRGKYICRSATISINAETYGRKVVDYAYDYLNGTNYSERANITVDDENNEDSLVNNAINEPSPFSYEEVIKSDIQLLNALNVTTIIDLMVEKRKIKYFMTVSSSEKADPDNHYESFNLLSLPYPGCEFFKKFRDNNYMAKNLHYNWNQSFNDANICVPKLGPTIELNINWDEYKNWDLVLITQNYLKACLKYIQDNSGLLIHCISGWDRTPLFISLIRLSLWADGLIHQSFNHLQISYFTLAYDWYLFGHQLTDRLKRGEDIMFFCFHVLKFITEDEFSIREHRKRTKTSSSSGSSANVVLKSDCCDEESLKEELMMGYDQDSNDSISNSSICDMSTTDNLSVTASPTGQGTCSNAAGISPITNRSPNTRRTKTSPITVPGAAARQRHESTSSSGSWQIVTETGSLDSVRSGCMMRRSDRGDSSSCSNTLNDSGGSANSGDNSESTNKDNLPSKKPTISIRKQRLNSVRSLFIKTYGKTVGLKFKEGSSLNLTKYVGSITDQLFF